MGEKEWNNKGVCLGELKRYKEAIKFYEKAIEINPKYAKLGLIKVMSLLNSKNTKRR